MLKLKVEFPSIVCMLNENFWVRDNAKNEHIQKIADFFVDLISLNGQQALPPYQGILVCNECFHTCDGFSLYQQKHGEGEHYYIRFQPVFVRIDDRIREAIIIGDVLSFIGDNQVSESRQTYRAWYDYTSSGRVQLKFFDTLMGKTKNS